MIESINKEEKSCFNITLACELIEKSPDYVLDKCKDFDANILNSEELRAFREEMKIGQNDPPEYLELEKQITSSVYFVCTFKLHDYQAISAVSFNFINDIASECLISLGRPNDIARYSSEYSVFRVVLSSLEQIYRNGRIQQDTPENRVCTWKKDNKMLVSFVSRYHPDGQFLGIQIRGIQAHPWGMDLDTLYNKSRKYVKDIKLMTE
jgi:hypothetical protein